MRCNLRDLLTQKLAGQVEKGSLAAEFLAPIDGADRTRLRDLLARLAAAEPDGDGESSGIPRPGRE
ncbi:hypothetical protein [Pseudonocardia sp. HH130629-09]|uniref:hypothetical protein n=1 Tax=Pseudonocardia sp. HH130629-09 TaxID=1641402 RepID=UPI0011AEC19B|nr:hypothetical protein [Pseudonocardia sp. HH130629-09]